MDTEVNNITGEDDQRLLPVVCLLGNSCHWSRNPSSSIRYSTFIYTAVPERLLRTSWAARERPGDILRRPGRVQGDMFGAFLKTLPTSFSEPGSRRVSNLISWAVEHATWAARAVGRSGGLVVSRMDAYLSSRCVLSSPEQAKKQEPVGLLGPGVQ